MAKNTTNIETITIKPSEAVEVITAHALAKSPIFLWGGPGIGKSQISKQVAVKLDFTSFEDIRLSQMEPTDLRGIPVPHIDKSGRQTVAWSLPSFYDPETGYNDEGVRYTAPTMRDTSLIVPSKRFYLLDEMNSAPQSTQAASYQLSLDRRIGPHVFGPDDFVMAAGNRETDRGATFKMATPLMNRFTHFELVVDHAEWESHAIINGFHPSVVGYLNWQKINLYQFNPNSASRGFATPRSWEAVSRLLNSLTAPMSAHAFRASVTGAVGQSAAAEFIEFYRRATQLPNPTHILDGTLKNVDLGDDVGLVFNLIMSLGYELRDMNDARKRAHADLKTGLMDQNEVNRIELNYHSSVDNFIAFLMASIRPELIVVGMSTVVGKLQITIDYTLPNWKLFMSKYGKMIMVA